MRIGPERRVHSVCLTYNREYHLRSRMCIAVRDRESGAWLANHDAVGMEVDATMRRDERVGHPLLLQREDATVRTSPVIDVFRPRRQTAEVYPLLLALAPSA